MKRIVKTLKILESTNDILKSMSEALCLPESYIVDMAIKNYNNKPDIQEAVEQSTYYKLKNQLKELKLDEEK